MGRLILVTKRASSMANHSTAALTPSGSMISPSTLSGRTVRRSRHLLADGPDDAADHRGVSRARTRRVGRTSYCASSVASDFVRPNASSRLGRWGLVNIGPHRWLQSPRQRRRQAPPALISRQTPPPRPRCCSSRTSPARRGRTRRGKPSRRPRSGAPRTPTA